MVKLKSRSFEEGLQASHVESGGFSSLFMGIRYRKSGNLHVMLD